LALSALQATPPDRTLISDIHRGKHINPLTAFGTTSSRTIARKEMVDFLAE